MGVVGVNQFDQLEPNQRIATVALQIYSQPLLGLFANILAVLAMFTSFLTLGVALVEMYFSMRYVTVPEHIRNTINLLSSYIVSKSLPVTLLLVT